MKKNKKIRHEAEQAVNRAEAVIESAVEQTSRAPRYLESYDEFDEDESYRAQRLQVVRHVYRYKLIYAIVGAVLGFVSMIGGIILFLYGVVGKTTWIAEFLGARSQLTDAAPGAILFVVGLIVVFISRFRLRIQTGSGSRYWG